MSKKRSVSNTNIEKLRIYLNELYPTGDHKKAGNIRK